MNGRLGRHALGNGAGIPPVLLDDAQTLEDALTYACTDSGATVLNVARHRFEPQGVTVLILLAESHASIHTWPEHGACAVDVFTCGDVSPERILGHVRHVLGGRWVVEVWDRIVPGTDP